MRGLISGKKLSFFCVLLSVMVLLSIIGANADMPMPQPVIYKVEIQGAHKVSEGGNLWFYMVNHDNQSFDVTVQYQGGVRCFNHSAIIENSYWQLNPFVLPENASANIFFQALNVSGQKVSNEFLFLITPHVHPPENSSYQVHTDRVDFFTVIEPLEDQSPFPPHRVPDNCNSTNRFLDRFCLPRLKEKKADGSRKQRNHSYGKIPRKP